MKTKYRSVDVVNEMPLFNMENEISIPSSPKELTCKRIHRDTFMPLNEEWHSRLPDCKNAFEGFCFGAILEGFFYAVAWWSKPVARTFNGKNFLELRRLAINDTAPKYTATWMLSQMRKDIKSNNPEIVKLISYQDTEVHTGTIYKADNWHLANCSEKVTKGWESRGSNRQNQSTAPKIRWEYDLKGRKNVKL